MTAVHVAESSVLRGLRILLAEDTAETREALTSLLEGEGAEVTSVALGRAAIDAMSASSFDVVLTDLGLPDMTGDVVIRHALETIQPQPTVIAMTGHTEPYRQRALEAGAITVLVKPFDWSALRLLLVPVGTRRSATAA